MAAVALTDFGSTYTKVRLVDRDQGRVLARAQAPTTIGTDLMAGYAAALEAAQGQLPEPVAIGDALAVSSAGGGLRVAAIGLVADLTAAAARQAALNAGARVGTVLAGELGAAELARLDQAAPEIVLFAGGTDGGQADLVLANARRLAAHGLAARVVVACNAAVAEPVAATLDAAGIAAVVADNVMPKLGRLEIESARAAISAAFLEHVIGGKRLSADPEFARMVRMPTPEAVLAAVRLYSRGPGGSGGVGDVIVVDVGGATTDVHSDRAVEPATPGIEGPLLPSPPTLRTVEGDLGLRAGAPGVLAVDRRWIEERLAAAGGEGHGGEGLEGAAAVRVARPAWVPEEPGETDFDRLLATACVAHALDRHCGTMLLSRSEQGPPTLVRDGPDLREVSRLIGTGGIFAHGEGGEAVLRAALERRQPRSLAPRAPAISLDRGYVLAAAGLLASVDESGAFRLLERELGDRVQA
ncbi:MAG TPA: glutamate mutase L [Solirubrobacterales bacterium]|nr:glutamate mutase L [Solirubrobacterales bacterium]